MMSHQEADNLRELISECIDEDRLWVIGIEHDAEECLTVKIDINRREAYSLFPSLSMLAKESKQ